MAKRKQRGNVENPKPRIGRGEYTRGERIFKPSKRLQKKYKRVRDTYKEQQLLQQERERERLQLEQQEYQRVKREYEDERRSLLGTEVAPDKPLRNDLDNVTILANQYGISETADMLGVDEDFLDFALRGHPLSRTQRALLSKGYNDLILSGETDIDFDLVEDYAETLALSIIFVNEERYHGDELKDAFRYVVAEGKFDIVEGLGEIDGTVVIQSLMLHNKMSPASKAKIIEWLLDEDNNADRMIAAWREDLENTGGFIEELESSRFWAWFRDTFYP
jgi:hypothetical protein